MQCVHGTLFFSDFENFDFRPQLSELILEVLALLKIIHPDENERVKINRFEIKNI